MRQSQYRVPERVLSRRLDDEIVLIDLDSEEIFELNVTATRVWELLESGLALEVAASQLAMEFDARAPEILEHSRELVSSLLRLGFLERAAPRIESAPTSPRAARRVLRWRTGRPHWQGAESPHTSIHIAPDGSFVLVAGYLLGASDGEGTTSLRRSEGITLTDAEMAWRRYERSGLPGLEALSGAFLIVVWLAAEDRLIAMRDAMGLWPVYYQHRNGELLLSDQLLDLAKDVQAVPHIALLAEYVCGRTSERQLHETFFENVARLPAAHHLRTRSGQAPQLTRYWDPIPESLEQGMEWATAAEIARLPEVLDAAVRRCRDAGADAIALSGGFDSVSIAVLAAQQMPTNPLLALSLRMTHSPNDEGAVQASVARELGMPQVLHEMPPPAQRAAFVERALAVSSSLPSPVLSPWQWMYEPMLESAHAQGRSHVLVGTGGDEMFIVDVSYAEDLVAGRRWSELAGFVRAWANTSPLSSRRVAYELLWKGAARPMTLRRLPFVGRRQRFLKQLGMTSELRTTLSHRTPAASRGGYLAALREMLQSPLLMMELEQAEAWGRRFGATFFYPFYDRDLVELALRIPPPVLYASGRMKSPLRDLVRQRAPQLQLPSRKVDFTDFGNSLLRRSIPAALESMGGLNNLCAAGITKESFLHSYFASYAKAPQRGALAWRLLSAEVWLREHR